MKLVKRISLFMALSTVMLGLGGWGALKAEEFFYPNRYHRQTEGGGARGRLSQSASPFSDIMDAGASDMEEKKRTNRRRNRSLRRRLRMCLL